MNTAKQIRQDLRDASKRGANVYVSLLHPPANVKVFRIIAARERDGITQVRLLTYNATWRTLESGDAIFTQ